MLKIRRRKYRLITKNAKIVDKIDKNVILRANKPIITDMEKITITLQDMRRAISYGRDCKVDNFSDEQLLNADFGRDLHMGNIRLANVAIELQRIYNISLPIEMFHQMKDNTVRSFIESANKCLAERA